MSTYFLRRFAQRLLEEFPEDLSRITVVLPTSRARLFLLRHLHELKGGAFWSPRCLILPEWVRSNSPGRIGGELEMIVAMFEQYRDTVKGNDSFESFLGWQGVAMRDFNDVDAALAPAKRIFSDLRNIREIEIWNLESWSFERNPLSQTQEDFLRFWKQLSELYHAFTNWQDEHKCWTYARAVRYLADHPDEMIADTGTDQLFFVGLGNYSAAERMLIRNAGKQCKVELVWDIDGYYYHNKEHEAGISARSWKDTVNQDAIGNRIVNRPIEAHIIKSATSISQVMRVAEILAELSPDQLENTCLVINDESALEPLLSAITDVRCEVNLAIGKPLQQTYLSRIAEELFVLRSLHLRKGRMYYKPFVNWIQMVHAAHIEAEACETIRNQIVRENLAQVTQENLQVWSAQFPGLQGLMHVLHKDIDPGNTVQLLLHFIQEVDAADDFMKVARQKLIAVLEELNTLIGHTSYMNNDALLLKLYQLVIGRMKLYYEGEPVNGLQLLSLSETRALDFERVFFLGANEDYFPGERFEQSFIPFDLRSHYLLVMPEQLDAVHSYTYYRLLHEAKEVYFFYSAIVADTKPGEPSRYITQLTSELRQANKGLEVFEEHVSTIDTVGFKEGVVSSDFIRNRIRDLLSAGISPSAINKLISCPLDFYYLYIARLGEENEVEENLSSSTFGQIVHKVLEDFYRPFLQSFPDEAAFLNLKQQLERLVLQASRELYNGRSIDRGIDYLSVRIAIEMLEKYIDAELELLNSNHDISVNRKVVIVENEFIESFREGIGGLPIPFALKGKIDRCDSVAGVLHLIDYKTGKIGTKKGKFKGKFDELFTNKDYSKFLQLLIYILMTRDRNQPIPSASFYSMREAGGSFVHAQDLSELEINHEFMDQVEEALGRFLKGLLERESFQHNTNAHYCEYCFTKP